MDRTVILGIIFLGVWDNGARYFETGIFQTGYFETRVLGKCYLEQVISVHCRREEGMRG